MLAFHIGACVTERKFIRFLCRRSLSQIRLKGGSGGVEACVSFKWNRKPFQKGERFFRTL